MAGDPNGGKAVTNEPLSERASRYKKEVERSFARWESIRFLS